MSSTNSPQDPYGTGDQPDRSSGSTPPPYGSTPPPPPGGDSSQPPYGSAPAYGSTPGGYGSTPPSYGGSSAYGSTPPAYGAEYGGTQSPYGYGTYPQNNLGVWSLVLGLVAIFVCGLFAGIPAIIVGNRAKRAAAAGEANNPGLATAGVILGWISVVFSILGIIAAIFLISTGVMFDQTGAPASF